MPAATAVTAVAHAASCGTASRQQLPAVRQQRQQLLRQLLQWLKQQPTRTGLRSWLHCTVQLLLPQLLAVLGGTSGCFSAAKLVNLQAIECSC